MLLSHQEGVTKSIFELLCLTGGIILINLAFLQIPDLILLILIITCSYCYSRYRSRYISESIGKSTVLDVQ